MAALERPGFKERLEGFVAGLETLCEVDTKKHYASLEPPKITYDVGGRYVRIVRNSHGSRSSHCFIDRTNGNVLKCNSWKSPETKHPRANVYDDDFGLSGVTPYGAVYLRG